MLNLAVTDPTVCIVAMRFFHMPQRQQMESFATANLRTKTRNRSKNQPYSSRLEHSAQQGHCGIPLPRHVACCNTFSPIARINCISGSIDSGVRYQHRASLPADRPSAPAHTHTGGYTLVRCKCEGFEEFCFAQSAHLLLCV